jgi:Lysine-specific metallo-endopeptidase
MKLAAPIRRHFRRPPRLQQQAGFFAKEGESPAFFQPGSEPRMKEESSFFSAKGKEEELQAKEPEEQEAPAAKAPEEEEPVKAKQKEGEEPPIAKCSCGCGGSDTCGKSAASVEKPEQAKAPADATSAHESAAARIGQTDCSPTQERVAASAASEARSLAERARWAAAEVASLGDDSASSATGHYERWFGTIDDRRARLVRDTFAAIASGLGDTLHFRCDSGKGVYAYVRSSGSREVCLGRLFWSRAGSSGIDSRPGVILHEVAHDVSRLIGDHSYGVAAAEALAAKNPDNAVRSADNYEYFAESL